MNRTRPKQIVIRLTEKELETVKEKIEKSGMTQQEYLIKAITQKTIYSTEGMKVLLPEIKRIGNNLNQIARSCNEGNQATYHTVKEQGKELNEVWRLLRRLIQGRVSDTP